MSHIHDAVDFTVEVFIVYQNIVFLRKHDKYKKWLGVGGHIEPKEDPAEAALREVKEEVGLSVVLWSVPRVPDATGMYVELPPPVFLNRHRINDRHEHVTMVYFATAPTCEIHPGEDEVSEEMRWFTVEELHDPRFGIGETIAKYAGEALLKLGSTA
ncbi:MAG: hypothetical protein A3I44_01220 [Candidatus Sungbacteria bacterium RIFCSPLOWO2_02_FULL_51_17]|uniref:Nudix hydrolase domain-containing protein n=1 Tax=Candidatus Sungbacteria bacterium RIFCSPHIGHO2_02_FULL_51_29 TaxID=1802273 RepID=A0A1G2KRY2_9BACT|nr:MAG: hypothetical protein A2676_00925 [Candidatus Sungbacteria bacterium RIFCSPHIGHO2_01_FULL_51_22]OHA02195.1 MAG: hypothetical protein A3C16_00720 [Candidatus Sungbacteria bacterium RIFCSPHIGHO2_02_FULL_51_29]OHA07646.1 MAG: hypothetical protein A3B29_05615 [Candidatus Sungbacteria bacterium RIFCSPLOWO2_01_FULL_51_34]OHA10741.1 MAG: hypothetical protein A3I44_01220 [Candidatus Sungbacteria bacterium RIFCSPLOWO2_02_FULL_51_17]